MKHLKRLLILVGLIALEPEPAWTAMLRLIAAEEKERGEMR